MLLTFDSAGKARCRYNSYFMKERTSNPRRAAKSSIFQRVKGWTHSIIFKIIALLVAVGFIAVAGFFIYFYEQDSRTIDRFLGGELFQHTARLYARPYHIYPGQKLRAESVVARLQR